MPYYTRNNVVLGSISGFFVLMGVVTSIPLGMPWLS